MSRQRVPKGSLKQISPNPGHAMFSNFLAMNLKNQHDHQLQISLYKTLVKSLLLSTLTVRMELAYDSSPLHSRAILSEYGHSI